MTTTTNPTQDQIKELVRLEEVLAVLDESAAPHGTGIQRAYSRMYAELDKLRASELAGWNCELEDAPGRLKLARCTKADHPYHTDQDGPCDVYTANASGMCGLHELLAEEELEDYKAGRNEYLLAKQRGEDV